MTTSMKYELEFFGAAMAPYFPRYQRMHINYPSAICEAAKVFSGLIAGGYPTACHTPICHGPGMGPYGRSINDSEMEAIR